MSLLTWLRDRRYHELRREIQRIDDDVAQLRSFYERLRGRFYATRGEGSGPPPVQPGTRAEKDAILRDFLSRKVSHGDT